MVDWGIRGSWELLVKVVVEMEEEVVVQRREGWAPF